MAPRRPKSPPSTLVLYVRHARTPTTGQVLPGRTRGLHLGDEGQAQAEATAARIAALTEGRGERRVEAVYASPMERAKETARPIAKALGLRVTVERSLVECDFGEWTGAELKALAKLPAWRTVQQWPSGFRFPGGESFTEMQARIVGAADRLRSHHPGATVVAVSHADPIKAVVAHALGTHLDLFQRISIAPASVTAIAYGDTGPSVLTVNATAALSELRPS
ncbi:MAG TPA: MSMEG_4193 family putative phosphomutase [Acidimicrobiales bacterium]|jgi:probable phosphoglycerate mutase|nr:MSMEG_4193 family putative phosphomutase [Acidimicrobiales bacterium]